MYTLYATTLGRLSWLQVVSHVDCLLRNAPVGAKPSVFARFVEVVGPGVSSLYFVCDVDFAEIRRVDRRAEDVFCLMTLLVLPLLRTQRRRKGCPAVGMLHRLRERAIEIRAQVLVVIDLEIGTTFHRNVEERVAAV